jgi:hypothetical protein
VDLAKGTGNAIFVPIAIPRHITVITIKLRIAMDIM